MQIPLLAEQYDDCRQTCHTIAADLARLTVRSKNKNFLTEVIALLRCDLIDAAAMMLKIAPSQADQTFYTIELRSYQQLLDRLSGITGIAILFLNVSRSDSFHAIVAQLTHLLDRLSDLLPATT